MAEILPTKWKSSVEKMRSEFFDRFDRLFSRMKNEELSERRSEMPFLEYPGPLVDLEEQDEELIVKAEIPGLSKEDFKVEVDRNRLIIRGEKKSTREEKESNYYYSECSYGSFSRILRLPAEIDPEKVKADYKKGILKIHLPKTEEEKAKKVTVDVK